MAETGAHAPSADVYRAAARLYGRIRVAYAAACAGECRRLEDFERQWRARGRTVHTALANWRTRWVDTGVCDMEGGIASQRLLPSQPPGDLTGSAGGAPTPELTLPPHAVAPAAVFVHLTARPLRWGIEPHYCWGYTLQRLGGGHAQIVLDRQGREEERLSAQLAGLADAMQHASAGAQPGDGTVVIVTSPDRDSLKLAGGTWDTDEQSLGAYLKRPAEECRALAALARRAQDELDALRQNRTVYMRDAVSGAALDRASALAWRAPEPLRLQGCPPRIPGLLYQRGPADDDAGSHGWGRCVVCFGDFTSGLPTPAAHGGNLPAPDCPRPPGDFAWPCAHSLCYDCGSDHRITRCPLCQRGRA